MRSAPCFLVSGVIGFEKIYAVLVIISSSVVRTVRLPTQISVIITAQLSLLWAG